MVASRLSRSSGVSGISTGVARSRSATWRLCAVEAEDVVHARRVGHEDLVGVERVDAEREAAGLELGDHLRALVEPVAVEREPEVDDVGAGVAVVARRRDDPLAVEARDVVDLGEHADVARAVARARVGLPEERRQRA